MLKILYLFKNRLKYSYEFNFEDFNSINNKNTSLILSNHASILFDSFYNEIGLKKKSLKKILPVVGSNLYYPGLKQFFNLIGAIKAPRNKGLTNEQRIEAGKVFTQDIANALDHEKPYGIWYASTGGRNKKGGIDFDPKVLNQPFNALEKSSKLQYIPTIIATLNYERQREEVLIVENVLCEYLSISKNKYSDFKHMLVELGLRKSILNNKKPNLTITFNEEIELRPYSSNSSEYSSLSEYNDSLEDKIKISLASGLRPTVHHYNAFFEMLKYREKDSEIKDFLEKKYNITNNKISNLENVLLSELNNYNYKERRNEKIKTDNEINIIDKKYDLHSKFDNCSKYIRAGLLAYRANTAIDYHFYKNKKTIILDNKKL